MYETKKTVKKKFHLLQFLEENNCITVGYTNMIGNKMFNFFY